jgi:hypothetical protein
MPAHPWIRRCVSLVLVALSVVILPRLWHEQSVEALAKDDAAAEQALARGVIQMVDRSSSSAGSLTGSARFDGEWRMVTEQMTALGLGQLVLEQPELRAEYLPVIARSVERLQREDVTAFGQDAWGRRGFDDLESDRGHAYLGYANMAFGMLRLLDPGAPIGPLHDRVTAALARRLAQAQEAVIETYPGETYPADVAAVAASIALHDRATAPHDEPQLDHWLRAFLERYVDPSSGLLYQSVDARSGTPLGPPRASGTAIAVYFLSFVHDRAARELFAAISRQRASFLGFGGIREYPSGVSGSGDIDSGPLFLGVSASASAFTLAGARLYGESSLVIELLRTAALVGLPIEDGGRLSFASGGALGNAIVLAALTSRRFEPAR